MSTNIKQAVVLDCERLVEQFVNNNSYGFDCFCKEWRRMQFRHIYSGLMRDIEIIQMTEEIFRAASRILLANQSVPQRIGALYLIYAVYFKQPTEQFVKFKVTLKLWKNLKDLMEMSKNEPETMQVRYVFLKLLASNAFRFVFMENDCGLEQSLKRNQTHVNNQVQPVNFLSMIKNDINELTHPTKGYLESLSVLEGGYNEMKEIMYQQEKTDSSTYQKLDVSNFMDQIKSSISKISDILCKNDGHENDEQKKVSDAIEEQLKEDSICKTRANIRKKARAHKRINTENGGYAISLNGDMIHIVSKNAIDNRTRVSQQTANKLFAQALPSDTLKELKCDENLELDNSSDGSTVVVGMPAIQ